MNKLDLERLADLRLAEAEALLALTPPMPERTAQHDFPDKSFAAKCFTHKARELVPLAGLDIARATAMASDAALARNWLIVKDWTEESRYERWTIAEATALIDAIREPNHGVLKWIKGHW